MQSPVNFKRWYYLLVIFYFLLITPLIMGEEYDIAPARSWINDIAVDINKTIPDEQVSNGLYYMLYDKQVKIIDGTYHSYKHFAIKVINSDGLENVSQIAIDFDPSYQKLIIHRIMIKRGTEDINRLDRDKITLLQREKDREYLIYDGTKTADIILDDVRINDIVEYSYTIVGNNPVFEGKYFDYLDFSWSIALGQLYYRILCPDRRKLTLRKFLHTIDPVISKQNGYREYLWEVHDTLPQDVDDNLPDEYNAYALTQISEHESWEEVGAWAYRLFNSNDPLPPDFENMVLDITKGAVTQKEQVVLLLRFIQEKIRYLGIEIGPGSHKPTAPAAVLERRFGDCKDKTLLMITMLDVLGIKAYPALVNTYKKEAVTTVLPTVSVFNHVIVYLPLYDNDYWLDPTINNQGGTLDTINRPDYGVALVVKDDTRELMPISDEVLDSSTKHIVETFDLSGGIGNDGTLTVEVSYLDEQADTMRSTLVYYTKDEMQKDYLNYYAKYYPEITTVGNIEVTDDRATNLLTTREHYTIPDVWTFNEDEQYYEVEFYPGDLASAIKKPKTIQRTMPYKIDYPLHIDQIIEITLPGDDWDINNTKKTINNSAFMYEEKVDYAREDSLLTLTYRYKTLKPYITPDEVKKYLSDVNKINDSMGYYLSYSGDSTAASTADNSTYDDVLSSITAIIILCLILFFIFFRHFRKKFRNRGRKTKKKKPTHFHKCALCGKTDLTHPDMIFRYCDDCHDDACYCSDHIDNHTHR